MTSDVYTTRNHEDAMIRRIDEANRAYDTERAIHGAWSRQAQNAKRAAEKAVFALDQFYRRHSVKS